MPGGTTNSELSFILRRLEKAEKAIAGLKQSISSNKMRTGRGGEVVEGICKEEDGIASNRLCRVYWVDEDEDDVFGGLPRVFYMKDDDTNRDEDALERFKVSDTLVGVSVNGAFENERITVQYSGRAMIALAAKDDIEEWVEEHLLEYKDPPDNTEEFERELKIITGNYVNVLGEEGLIRKSFDEGACAPAIALESQTEEDNAILCLLQQNIGPPLYVKAVSKSDGNLINVKFASSLGSEIGEMFTVTRGGQE